MWCVLGESCVIAEAWHSHRVLLNVPQITETHTNVRADGEPFNVLVVCSHNLLVPILSECGDAPDGAETGYRVRVIRIEERT